ncbi:L-amino acid N-acyltransferase YncA [Sporobacter termitidis DSM 10068]|uniref:L-amino acid N-acyltransferase YncA n=1 Tax=Sporobacter termitidis DSM 10068 TaxID=1123282 RepID=A0A1M5ZEE5_9FIRM|nr:GNAT family N-acetyltransferase [Sporobacter termitidis]SHI22554.1 L-amino acid N-acyltransferase YncA [Sporobacter termitidis DSM 10068]
MALNFNQNFDTLLQRYSEPAFIIEKDKKVQLPIKFRLCAKDDLEEIMALQSEVYENITAKEIFVFSTEDELSESLETDVCIGAYLFGKLIAFTLMVVNPNSLRNLGLYLDYSREQCLKCVTYDTTFIAPEYRGYGLQRLFITMKDAIARELGAREALATVSPDNAASINNLKASGFELAGEKKMYGGLKRYILRKSVTE